MTYDTASVESFGLRMVCGASGSLLLSLCYGSSVELHLYKVS